MSDVFHAFFAGLAIILIAWCIVWAIMKIKEIVL